MNAEVDVFPAVVGLLGWIWDFLKMAPTCIETRRNK
jgi:hypothetical protein